MIWIVERRSLPELCAWLRADVPGRDRDALEYEWRPAEERYGQDRRLFSYPNRRLARERQLVLSAHARGTGVRYRVRKYESAP